MHVRADRGERRVLGNGVRDGRHTQVRRREREAVPFTGVYAKETGSVTISLNGRVTY